jgi:hypothetical protein
MGRVSSIDVGFVLLLCSMRLCIQLFSILAIISQVFSLHHKYLTITQMIGQQIKHLIEYSFIVLMLFFGSSDCKLTMLIPMFIDEHNNFLRELSTRILS